MNAETILKGKQTKVRKHLERSIPHEWRWHLAGNEFVRLENIHGPKTGVTFGCWFYTNLAHVWVYIDGNEQYGLDPREALFAGDTAWSDCVDWITDSITEMDSIVCERLDSARPARAEYFRKLKGV